MTTAAVSVTDSKGVRRLRIDRPPSKLPARLAQLSPMMHENYSRSGVRDTIVRYLDKLGEQAGRHSGANAA